MSESATQGIIIESTSDSHEGTTYDHSDHSYSHSSGEDTSSHSGVETVSESQDPDANNPNRVRRFATIMNLLNSLLGAGILSVPSSFANVGLIPSIILLIIIALLSLIATYMIMKLQLETKSPGYDELTFQVMGNIGQKILSILTLIFLMAALLAYLILAGDMIISWFELAHIDLNKLWPRAAMILIYSLCIPVALSIPRSIKVLSYISTATFAFITLFAISMIVKAITDFPKIGVSHHVSYAKFDITVFSALSIYGLAFSLPIVTCTIVNNYNHNVRKRTIVAIAASILCFILIIVPSVIGYLMFGSETDGNILKNFPDDDVLMLIVRIGFFFVVSFSYPCITQPVMASWGQLLFKANDQITLPTKQRIVVELCANVIPVVVAMFLPEAKPILSVGGAIGGCVVDFVFPPLLWIVFYKMKKTSPQFILCVLFIIFGLVTAAISTYQSILDTIDSFKKVQA